METLIWILLILALVGFAFDGLLALLLLVLAAGFAGLSLFTGGLHWASNRWWRFRRWWEGWDTGSWEL